MVPVAGGGDGELSMSLIVGGLLAVELLEPRESSALEN
jgi:hypothetical protein